MTAIFVSGLLVALVALAVFLARREGRAAERLSKEEEINRAVEKARLARLRLDRDADYARRVRHAFTRRILPDLRTGDDGKERHGSDKTPDRPE